jgi:hypothetical protein
MPEKKFKLQDPIAELISRSGLTPVDPEKDRQDWERINAKMEEFRRQLILQEAEALEAASKLVINT